MAGRMLLVVLVVAGSMLVRGAAAADNEGPAWHQPGDRRGEPRVPHREATWPQRRPIGHYAAQRRRPGVARLRHQPYTARVTTTKRPEQAIIDWILRETGYEAWHTEPLGILERRAAARSASITRPKCRRSWPTWSIASPAARRPRTRSRLRVVTLDSPSWRTAAQRLLAAGAGANAGRQRLGAAQGRRRHPAGRTSPPQRLPRAQFALPDGQQRAVDGGFGDARPALRPRRDPPARHGRRLRSLAGAGRRGLCAWISARCCRPTAA